MKKVVIIDDEHLARAIVAKYLKAHSEFEVIAECKNGFEGVKAIEEHQPDLIFLDVQMPKINGFEMLELIENPPSIIFTTAFDEYAVKAFDENAIDYLLKPFDQKRFDNAIQKWKNREGKNQLETKEIVGKQPDEHLRIVVKSGSNIKILPTEDVLFLEAFDDYVKVFTKDDMYLKKKTMNYFEKTLSSADFFRVHRSFIINLNALLRIENFEKNAYRAILKENHSVSISRSAYLPLKKKLGV